MFCTTVVYGVNDVPTADKYCTGTSPHKNCKERRIVALTIRFSCKYDNALNNNPCGDEYIYACRDKIGNALNERR